MALFYRDIGIDLGTANTLVCVKGKGIVIREPSVMAMQIVGNKRFPLAVGEEARNMIGRTPGNIIAVRPMRDGVIADYEITQELIKEFIKKAVGRSFSFGVKTRIVICVPCGVTGVEKKAVIDAAKNAGASKVYIMEEPKASAIGAGLDINEPKGKMIVDIGGGTSEVAVISLGNIVSAMSLRMAGNKFDDAILSHIKKEYNLAIGERTAEDIKINIGSAYPTIQDRDMDVRGRDMATGLPKNITINSAQIREALHDPIMSIIDAIKLTLEKTPPELSADIMRSGIYLAGGGALISGLDALIRHETNMPVYIANDPLDCVALGAGKALEYWSDPDFYEQAY